MLTIRQFVVKALHAVSHRYVPARYKLPGLYRAYVWDNPEPELQHLPRLLTGRRTAVDVGANVGYWTYRMAGLFERVVSFEMNEDCYRHIEAHRLPNVTLHRHGLSNVQTPVHFYLPVLDNGFVSHGWGTVETARRDHLFTQWQTRTYEVKPLDDYALTGVDFIKIDVEGHELPVVEGAMQTIRANQPLLLIETDSTNLRTLTDWLSPLGYRVCSLKQRLNVPGSDGNYLFVPPADATPPAGR